MLIKRIDELIPSVMKSGDKIRLEAIKSIKVELKKAQTAVSKDYELSKEEEDKILLKMVSNFEEAISEFKKGGRQDLVDENEAQLAVIKEFAPKIATDEEIAALTTTVIDAYIKSMGIGYKLSMRDIKPIMFEVQQTYPTANGKVISQIIKSMMG